MKCIKSIRKTKDVEVGEIKRVDNKTADSMVGSTWMYIPKSEWKLATRKPKTTNKVTDQVTEQVSDQVDKKPYKKGSKSEKRSKKYEKNS